MVGGMDTAGLDPMGGEDLVDGAILEHRHLDGGLLEDIEAVDVSMHECLISDSTAGTVRLVNLHTTGTTIIGSTATAIELPGATLFSGGLEGVRIGVVRCDGSDISVFRIESSRIDLLSIRESRIRRVDIVDSRIGLLDLTGTRVREVCVSGGSIEELMPSRGRIDGFDLSGTTVDRVLDPAALKGATLTRQQAIDLGPALAEHLGVLLVD